MILSQATVMPPNLRANSWSQYRNPFEQQRGVGCTGLGCAECGGKCGKGVSGGLGDAIDGTTPAIWIALAGVVVLWMFHQLNSQPAFEVVTRRRRT